MRPVTLDQQSVGRIARMDAMQVQAMAKEAEARRKVRRQRILGALGRMEAGEFGFCTRCGERISDGRLTADPTSHQCVSCAVEAIRTVSRRTAQGTAERWLRRM